MSTYKVVTEEKVQDMISDNTGREVYHFVHHCKTVGDTLLRETEVDEVIEALKTSALASDIGQEEVENMVKTIKDYTLSLSSRVCRWSVTQVEYEMNVDRETARQILRLTAHEFAEEDYTLLDRFVRVWGGRVDVESWHVVQAIDLLLEGHGVESFRTNYGGHSVTYINMGDCYIATLYWYEETSHYHWGDVASIIEADEQEHGGPYTITMEYDGEYHPQDGYYYTYESALEDAKRLSLDGGATANIYHDGQLVTAVFDGDEIG